jgi:hypothetical protein
MPPKKRAKTQTKKKGKGKEPKTTPITDDCIVLMGKYDGVVLGCALAAMWTITGLHISNVHAIHTENVTTGTNKETMREEVINAPCIQRLNSVLGVFGFLITIDPSK